MMTKKTIFLLLFSLFSIGLIEAQVGINTTDPKVSLDVQAAKSDGTTAEGITAPRLTLNQLVSKDAKYSADQTGAIVYVTDIAGATSAKTAKVTAIGYYFFDGAIWRLINGNAALQFFYMPSIPFDTSVDAVGQTKDLYNLYYKQFTGTSGNFVKSTNAPATIPHVPTATDLYYYISDYDNTVFSNMSINANGVLTYDVKAAATDATFINIIFVLK